MNVSSWSIRNPVPAVLVFILLTVFGLIGFAKLQVQDFPDTDLPTVTVTASLEGAAPSQLETEVARKIEDKLASLTLLDHITTTITDGTVSISVSFTLDKDSEVAVNEVRNAVDSARSELPSEMDSPTVSKATAASSTLLTYIIESERLDEQDLSWFVDNDVTKALRAVPGVSEIDRVGGIDREVHIDLDPVLMAGLGVTPSDVSARLKAVQKESSGGQGDIGGQRQSARMIATVESIDEIAGISIALEDGRWVRLDQIARISDAHAERSSRALHGGKRTIGFQITRSLGFSDVSVTNDVRAAIAEFSRQNPQVTITEVSDTIEPVVDNYQGSMLLLLEGALLAVIVVWWFLRDWRATFIAAVALPLSILPTFAFMWLAGYSLNVVTLLSLALVVGILVDDAIVEVENIERHLLMGKTPYRAAMEAADEIGLAVIATTFTLVAVFLPTAFMGGIPGKFFRQFGVTASVAVLASLLVARLLTPMMAAYMLKPRTPGQHSADGALMTRYLGLARSSLRRRKTTMLAASLFFFLCTALALFIPTAFMPAQDKAQSSITLKLAPGSTLADTTDMAMRAVAMLEELPEVRSVFVSAGTASSGDMGGAETADLTSATLTVDLLPRGERELKQSAVEAKMRDLLRTLPGVRVSVGGANSGETLELTLASDDPDILDSAAAKVEAQLRTLPGIGNVTSSAALQRPEIQLRPDYASAAHLGVTSEALGDALRLATYGDYSTALPKLNLPQRQIDIRVRMDPAIRSDLDAIAQLRVQGRDGLVSLGSVAELSLGSGPSQIDRIDRLRNVTLRVELNGRPIGEVQKEAMALPAMAQLPDAVRQVDQGELQRMSELFESFGLAMAIGIFCIYAVLVLLFHDFMQPATILSALPLALAGALFALWVVGQSFSMPVVIGVLMLMGIVTKNSILLVEYAIVSRRLGMARFDALIDACHKRARPIVMTTIAMGVGMLPNALGLGAEPSFRQPMAIVVIGGLITSTVLSLVVVPVVFTYVDDLLQWIRRYFPYAQAPSEAKG
ncbi:efflux RND transporter permease subunit [Pseudomonas aeruginosa]|uniref:efflux RND transporter permease subunit n=1 Tax=Pseudomonas aeruginosa TaxID=287 RepID=UPI00053EF22D|nr:efflux RND transporter permease subunit [Pseudomonas aeruginosa]